MRERKAGPRGRVACREGRRGELPGKREGRVYYRCARRRPRPSPEHGSCISPKKYLSRVLFSSCSYCFPLGTALKYVCARGCVRECVRGRVCQQRKRRCEAQLRKFGGSHNNCRPRLCIYTLFEALPSRAVETRTRELCSFHSWGLYTRLPGWFSAEIAIISLFILLGTGFGE